MHFPESVGSQFSARTSFSFGTRESGERSAVAELVVTTPISTSVSGIRESQSKDAQVASSDQTSLGVWSVSISGPGIQEAE